MKAQFKSDISGHMLYQIMNIKTFSKSWLALTKLEEEEEEEKKKASLALSTAATLLVPCICLTCSRLPILAKRIQGMCYKDILL